jgi:hypothetical protein
VAKVGPGWFRRFRVGEWRWFGGGEGWGGEGYRWGTESEVVAHELPAKQPKVRAAHAVT